MLFARSRTFSGPLSWALLAIRQSLYLRSDLKMLVWELSHTLFPMAQCLVNVRRSINAFSNMPFVILCECVMIISLIVSSQARVTSA